MTEPVTKGAPRLEAVEAPRQTTAAKYLQIRDYRRLQHYKERRPPWVKLHGEQIEDYEFQQLPDATRFHALALTWLASRYENKIPNDAAWVASKIGAHEPVNLSQLIQFGFLEPWQPRLQAPGPGEQMPLPSAEEQASTVGTPASDDASNTLATRYQSASPETETAAEAEAKAETAAEAETAPASAGKRERLCGCCGQNVFSEFILDDAHVLTKQWKRSGKIVSGRLIENTGGLARKLHRDGTADDEIRELLHPPKPVPKRQFTDQPCTVCFGIKQEVVAGKGARPCEHCRDERGERTGREPAD